MWEFFPPWWKPRRHRRCHCYRLYSYLLSSNHGAGDVSFEFDVAGKIFRIYFHLQNMDEGVDMLSALPDHLLLSILERVDINSAVSTSVLSSRWRHLPWRLSKIRINTKDQYLPVPTFAKAIESFLAAPASERTIQSLRLQFSLPDGDVDEKYTSCSNSIGNSLVEAIDGGKVTAKVELLIGPDAKVREPKVFNAPPTRDDEYHLMYLTGASTPGVFARLHTLSLFKLQFSASDNVITKLLSSCKLLEFLEVSRCHWNVWDVVEIDAPESRLKDLTIKFSLLEIIELGRLPRLAKLACHYWDYSSGAPLCFASDSDTPCLQQLTLSGEFYPWQEKFEMSDLLRNAAHIPHLSFDFWGSKIWIRPEDPKQLAPTLDKLKILDLQDICYECDLSWIILILEAARVLEILHIVLSPKNNEQNKTTLLDPMSDGFLQKSSNFKHYHLRQLGVVYFMPKDNQIQFIRLVMERAVRLRAIYLIECFLQKDEENLADSILGSAFPKNQVQKDIIVKQFKEGISSPAQILFWDLHFLRRKVRKKL